MKDEYPDQKALDALYRRFNKPTTPQVVAPKKNGLLLPTVDAVIEKLTNEKTGKAAALLDGDTSGYTSPSEADQALFNKAYFYTQDYDQCVEVYRRSRLYRPGKGHREDYLRRTFEKANKTVTEHYDWDHDALSLNGFATYNPQPQGVGRSRSRSLSSVGMRNQEDRDLKHSIQALSFTGRAEPCPREWVVDNIIWKGHATSWFGEGGASKSILALHLALTVAAKLRSSWMGFAVKTVPVLYVDFELDADEQYRRAYQIANGMGLDDIPEDFYYLPVAMTPPREAFEIAAEECRRLGIGLVIVDSVGFALDGDSEASRDELGFFRDNIHPLKDAGASPLLIDHQAKLIKGERYSDKKEFGSVYKGNNVRSSLQIRGIPDQGEVTATFTHKKNNFGPLEQDFSLRVVFGGELITVELLLTPVPNPDQQPNIRERVFEAFEELGRATAEEVSQKTDIPKGSVRNAVTALVDDGELEDTGDKRGRARILIPHSQSTKGTGTGTNLDQGLNLEDIHGPYEELL